eukprot:scaffold92140_cov20-Tisochrysis_lutea.AAC.1
MSWAVVCGAWLRVEGGLGGTFLLQPSCLGSQLQEDFMRDLDKEVSSWAKERSKAASPQDTPGSLFEELAMVGEKLSCSGLCWVDGGFSCILALHPAKHGVPSQEAPGCQHDTHHQLKRSHKQASSAVAKCHSVVLSCCYISSHIPCL